MNTYIQQHKHKQKHIKHYFRYEELRAARASERAPR